jgi:hypothetical protein
MWGGRASNYTDDDDEQAESHERKRQELLQVSHAPACCSPAARRALAHATPLTLRARVLRWGGRFSAAGIPR